MKLSMSHWTFFIYQDSDVIRGYPNHNTHRISDVQFDEMWQVWHDSYSGYKLRMVRVDGHWEVEFAP